MHCKLETQQLKSDCLKCAIARIKKDFKVRQSFFAGRALAGRGRYLLLLSLAKLELTFLFASRAAARSYRAIRCCWGDVFQMFNGDG